MDLYQLAVQEALKSVQDLYLNKPVGEIAHFELIQHHDYLEIKIKLPYLVKNMSHRFEKKIHNAVKSHLIKANLEPLFQIELISQISHRSVQAELKPMKNIKNIIAVASGKGGVGKSTISVNLALALKELGAKVGLVDADIYGPSIPVIFNDHSQPELVNNCFIPLNFSGLKVNSMGFLVSSDTAVMWRGPMISKVFDQLITETNWGELDFLVIDLPPGTGDIQLSMLSNVPITGLVMVTTPQDVALADVFRSVQMFKKLKTHILGVVENMSSHICTNCGFEEAIFGVSRADEIAKRFDIPLIASLPLDRAVCQAMDQGKMKELAFNKLPYSEKYLEIARKVSAFLALRDVDDRHKFPDISLN